MYVDRFEQALIYTQQIPHHAFRVFTETTNHRLRLINIHFRERLEHFAFHIVYRLLILTVLLASTSIPTNELNNTKTHVL